MKKEIRIFFTALMYFTRIPVPKGIDHDPAWLQKAPKYFPLVGIVVGFGCALIFIVFARFASFGIGIIASMTAGLLITGAFHEDGFADVCDGFGGGWTKEKILLIMKDSRIGAFGAIGLIAILGSKFLLRWSSIIGIFLSLS
jgi:adenosylcobinamide-GDP ribazoletransferase